MTDSPTSAPPRRPEAAATFRTARTIFRVRGVPVRVDASWLLMAAVIGYLFYSQLQVVIGDLGAPVVAVAAVAGALLFFASVLAHELGHALTSLDRDVPVLGITLFALGGVTESATEARSARHEFVIVGIGPFISLVLAAAFGLLATGLSGLRPAAAVAGYLGWTNLALAVFNIVPGYPLDGGRLLRSVLWWVTGAPHKATRWAARVGQVFAALLIAAGVLAFLRPPAGGLNGLWEVLIGAFLLRGATDSHRRARMRERLAGRVAREVMGSVPPSLPADQPLAEALERVQQRPSLLWPVGDPVAGGLLLEQIDAVPADRWPTTTVAQVAHDAETVTVDVDTAMDEVLDRLAGAPHNMLVVVDDGRAVGLLTPSLVSHLLV